MTLKPFIKTMKPSRNSTLIGSQAGKVLLRNLALSQKHLLLKHMRFSPNSMNYSRRSMKKHPLNGGYLELSAMPASFHQM
jgi:hypothetical protein